MNRKHIVLAVTGGIAAYKAADITSRLVKEGYEVRCIMTKSAEAFLTPLTLQTLSGNPVTTELFGSIVEWKVEHIALAQWADIFLIAPATANIIGKIANGIADDFLSTCVMATEAQVVIAPAMNDKMYANAIVQENIHKLKKLGYYFIEPAVGHLACGDVGKGKMESPENIVFTLKQLGKRDLEGKKILITAGPTAEAIDPVRYITNHSTGRMGYAIAEVAQRRGAQVTLISGPTHLDKPYGVEFISVTSAMEMYEAVLANYEESDVVIKTAAVADYRPEIVSKEKIKKSDGNVTLNLTRNPDILLELGKRKKNQILIGFAAETNNIETYAKSKLQKKNLDMIVANDVTKKGAGFGSQTNEVIFYYKDFTEEALPQMDKHEVAEHILDKIHILKHKGV